MIGKRRVAVELTATEARILLDAQKMWQNISCIFDDMGCDIDYITDALDKSLNDLFTICEEGVEEVTGEVK